MPHLNVFFRAPPLETTKTKPPLEARGGHGLARVRRECVTTSAPRTVLASRPVPVLSAEPQFRQYLRSSDSSKGKRVTKLHRQATHRTEKVRTLPNSSTTTGALDLTESRSQVYLIPTVLTAVVDHIYRKGQGLLFKRDTS